MALQVGSLVIFSILDELYSRYTGVEIISNSSGSHHELRKLNTRVNLISQATKLVCIGTLEHHPISNIMLTCCRVVVFICMQTSKAAMAIDCTMMDAQ